MLDEIIEERKAVSTHFNEKKQNIKHKISKLLVFLVITTALLIAVSINFYLIKYQEKQKTFSTIS